MKQTTFRSVFLFILLVALLGACDSPPATTATLVSTAALPAVQTGTAVDEGGESQWMDTAAPPVAVESTTRDVGTETAAAAVTPTTPPTPTDAPTPTPAATPTPAPPPTYTYTVINTFPHDPAAFTQGLVYHDGGLYEGTGRWGESSLREVVLETGSVVRSHPLEAQYFGEGITLLHDRIYQLTWQEQTGFVYDRATFEPLQTFSYPTEGWGITHDGERLIVSDGTSTIYFWDPETLQEIGRIAVRDHEGPLNRLNELEFVDGEIWANIWLTDRIARISPETGDVLGYIDLTGLLDTSELAEPVDVLNGIAYDPDTGRIFVTGKLWPSLFEIEVVPSS